MLKKLPVCVFLISWKLKMVKLIEINGDLFKTKSHLAHCVSSDFKMGAGIALQFKKMFGAIDPSKVVTNPGEIAVMKTGNHFIYYLVTKRFYYHKPNYNDLVETLRKMCTHMVNHNLNELSIPRIGCGLDKLSWEIVKSHILDVFRNTDIEITVYSV